LQEPGTLVGTAVLGMLVGSAVVGTRVGTFVGTFVGTAVVGMLVGTAVVGTAVGFGPPLQGWPFRAKFVGALLAPVKLAWKPKDCEPPVGRLAFQLALGLAVTCWPLWVITVFQ
jgi:hypothetical protein